MAPFKPRWTKTESKVVQEWIEQDSYSRPLGRFVRCPKCCYSVGYLVLIINVLPSSGALNAAIR